MSDNFGENNPLLRARFGDFTNLRRDIEAVNPTLAALNPTLRLERSVFNPVTRTPGIIPSPSIPGVIPTTPAPTINLATNSVLAKVQPGDLITAELINAILDRLGGLEATVAEVSLQLGPLASDTHTLVALGTGFETQGGIFLNGSSLLAGGLQRGINLVILDSNLNLKHRQSYDTFASADNSRLLAAHIQNLTAPGDIVIGVTHDSYILSLEASGKAALGIVGGAALALPNQGRDNAAFIGIVPPNKTGNYNYLVAVSPADAAGFNQARLSAMPFAWGVYSRALQRFVLGGASGRPDAAPAQPPTNQPTFTFQPTLTFNPTLTFQPTLNPTFTFQPTFQPTFNPTLTFQPSLTFQPTFNPSLTFQPSLINPGIRINNLSAIPGIGSNETDALSQAGIADLDKLAVAEVSTVARVLNRSLDEAASTIGMARNFRLR